MPKTRRIENITLFPKKDKYLLTSGYLKRAHLQKMICKQRPEGSERKCYRHKDIKQKGPEGRPFLIFTEAQK